MKKIIAFAGSNNTQSINKQLVTYAATFLPDVSVIILDLGDFEVPLYSPEREKDGIPAEISKFGELLDSADGLLISLAEYNGSYTPAFKNIFDWATREEKDVWRQKPMLLMATSPGKRGGAGVLGTATNSFPHLGGNIVSTFSLPEFHENFREGAITDGQLKSSLEDAITKLAKAL